MKGTLSQDLITFLIKNIIPKLACILLAHCYDHQNVCIYPKELYVFAMFSIIW